ncbi:MAG: SpaH/EbpB family LPXTG-anchored major pilin [Nigerium sp.]|nr:SpaH/EbpB family LPXTG-anchored major pilin [Nigerium sp.]
MKTTTMLRRRLAAGVGALVLVSTSLVAFASPASAAQPTDGTPPGNAAEGSTGTLYVHKHAGAVTDPAKPNNGTTQTIDRPTLAGVRFDVCLVKKLVTDEDWASITTATPTLPCIESVTSQTTPANGTVSFPNLGIGLYKVVEADYPAGVTPAADFLVSIPFPSQSGTAPAVTTTWLWDVHTYPKNGIEGEGEKTVGAPDANGLGSAVPWSIKTRPLGSFNNGAPLTAYKVTDPLDSRLTYVSGSAVVTMVAPGGIETELTGGGTHYTLTPPTGAGGTLEVAFNVTYVNSLPAGTTFRIDFGTTVTSVGDGKIKNKSTEYVNDQQEGYTPDEVQTNWGQAKLLKRDVNDATKVLAGATFQVYNVNANSTCAPLGTGPLNVLTNVPTTGATANAFVSDANGVVNIPGLWVGSNDVLSRGYCVVETVPPSGYVRDLTPKLITVTPGGLAEGVYSGNGQIDNTPVNGPDLPLTGAQGTALFTMAGLALVAIAGGGALVRARRNH